MTLPMTTTAPGVPTTYEEVLDPAWLGMALSDVAEGERVVAVEPVGTSKTLAEKLRFSLIVEGLDGERRTRSYCAKAHLDGSPGADIVPEALFYRDLGPQLDVRMPRVYYSAVDETAGQAIIIMDDVVALGGRFLTAHVPYALATARDSLTQLARLHAGTWAGNRTRELSWLQPRIGPMGKMVPADQLQSLLDDGRGPELTGELRDAGNLLEAVKKTSAHEITCVIHGDTHSGNSYLDASGAACWLDWQVVQRGNWATDVAYHIATVLDVEDRRDHEAGLLRHYLLQMEQLGAAVPSWEEAWALYASSFAWGYFLWVITRISSRAVVLVHIPRLAAALADHDTYRRLGVI